MLHEFQDALHERVTLLLNHVLLAEPAATARLQPHAGRVLEVAVSAWPLPGPVPPPARWSVSPAGLLEPIPVGIEVTPALKVDVPLNHPLRALGDLLGSRAPLVAIDGDAAFAADVAWLMENVRWDAAADLERLVGPGLAHQLTAAARTVAEGVRRFAGPLVARAEAARGGAPTPAR